MTLRKQVALELSSAEALVLFEFLSRFSRDGSLEVVDPAEEIVLWDVCASLESTLATPLAKDYLDILAKARAEIRSKEA